MFSTCSFREKNAKKAEIWSRRRNLSVIVDASNPSISLLVVNVCCLSLHNFIISACPFSWCPLSSFFAPGVQISVWLFFQWRRRDITTKIHRRREKHANKERETRGTNRITRWFRQQFFLTGFWLFFCWLPAEKKVPLFSWVLFRVIRRLLFGHQSRMHFRVSSFSWAWFSLLCHYSRLAKGKKVPLDSFALLLKDIAVVLISRFSCLRIESVGGVIFFRSQDVILMCTWFFSCLENWKGLLFLESYRRRVISFSCLFFPGRSFHIISPNEKTTWKTSLGVKK